MKKSMANFVGISGFTPWNAIFDLDKTFFAKSPMDSLPCRMLWSSSRILFIIACDLKRLASAMVKFCQVLFSMAVRF